MNLPIKDFSAILYGREWITFVRRFVYEEKIGICSFGLFFIRKCDVICMFISGGTDDSAGGDHGAES